MKTLGTDTPSQAVRPAGPSKDIVLEWNVRIPVRDGFTLGASLYRPKTDVRVPVIFSMTPYISDSYHQRAYYFAGCGNAERPGFAFALIDCRGRGNSEGKFEPFMSDGRDAADAIAWLAAQPWCDGQVTMWGGLYAGFNQWMALDAPDTDFVVTLAEILPDGQHIRLAQDWLRARNRISLTQELLVTPGEVLCYEFDGFSFFSRRIAKGSRLRLVIAAPNTIFPEKNFNAGGEVAAESAADARTVHVTLVHDAEHPSYLELPVVEV